MLTDGPDIYSLYIYPTSILCFKSNRLEAEDFLCQGSLVTKSTGHKMIIPPTGQNGHHQEVYKQ